MRLAPCLFLLLFLLDSGCTKDVGIPGQHPVPHHDPYARLDSVCGTYTGTQITLAYPATSPADSDTITVQVSLTRAADQPVIILSGLPNPWCGHFMPRHTAYPDSILHADSSNFNAFVNQNLEWFRITGSSVSRKTNYYNEYFSLDTLTTSSTSTYYVRELHVFR